MMTKIKILTAPHPSLQKKAGPIRKIDPQVKNLTEAMVKFLQKGTGGKRAGLGLAAPQIGQAIRLFVAYSHSSRRFLTFINPEIIWQSKQLTKGVPESRNQFEGCLSLPGIFGLVKRSKAVKIRYSTLNDQRLTRKFTGITATVIQHEHDHLEGILFTQRVLEQKSQLYKLEKTKDDQETLVELNPTNP